MISISRLWTRNLCILSLALGLLGGCAGTEPTGAVSGKVTLDGKPVPAGQISFISAAGFSAVANLGEDGSFTLLENMPVDKYTITLSPPAIMDAPGEEGGTAVQAKSVIPAGYFDESTSDLTQDIVAGVNTVTIELKAAGPANKTGPMDAAP